MTEAIYLRNGWFVLTVPESYKSITSRQQVAGRHGGRGRSKLYLQAGSRENDLIARGFKFSKPASSDVLPPVQKGHTF